MSIKSTSELYKELRSEGVHYLLTSRLNQDALENTFSTSRLKGGSDFHPSAVEVLNKIRKLCLIKNVKGVVNEPSVEIFNDDTFVSADLFDRIDGDLLDNVFNDEVANAVDEIQDLDIDSNEARNYVAGYIGKKLNLETNSPKKINSRLSVKGGGKLFDPSDKLSELCKNLILYLIYSMAKVSVYVMILWGDLSLLWLKTSQIVLLVSLNCSLK